MSDDPRLDPRHDSRMSELISDAVADVEPREGLDAIRSRTSRTSRSTKENTMATSRNWVYTVGGAVAGTAAVIVAIAVVANLGGDDSGNPDPATTSAAGTPTATDQPTASGSPTGATDSPSASDTATPVPIEGPVPVYYVGDGPRGLVLYREFHPGIGEDPLMAAARLATTGTPLDPDYRTMWPPATQVGASYDGDTITVDLSGDLHDRPAGLTRRQADLALQQVIYSVQAAVQDRAPVQFLIDGQHTDQVLGQPASEPLANAPVLETLSLMSITTPAEGQVVSGSFEAEGANNSFEASVSYEIRQGDQVVATGFGMAAGWGEDKLFAWKLTVDVSELEPGTYTFVALNDDPSGGAEGHGPDTDTRTIVVE